MLKFSAVSAEFAGACPSDGPEAHGPEHLEDALEDYPQKKLPIRPIVGLHLHAKSNQEAPQLKSIGRQLPSKESPRAWAMTTFWGLMWECTNPQ